MKILPLAKYILIFSVPIIALLFALSVATFDGSFYSEKFSQYGVDKDVEQPNLLHKSVINFIKGESNSLPQAFSQREASHLSDVRGVVKLLSYFLYFILALFGFFLIFAALNLRISNAFTNFFGTVMIYGGAITIILSGIMLISINANFSGFFDSFHRVFFEEGTYLFDPQNEVIVRLYPKEIFEDVGIRISKTVIITSALLIIVGFFMTMYSKRKIFNSSR